MKAPLKPPVLGVALVLALPVLVLFSVRHGSTGCLGCRNPQKALGGFRPTATNNNVGLLPHSAAIIALCDYLEMLDGG